ncbi:hypothetical protein PG994_008213 [Apiospora phragmitis]|uniref:Uncharacterized protein n=1 Tax=Apiospora phragmitis TaxID=2905665 RepID=A0ABR1USE3_9PEZI
MALKGVLSTKERIFLVLDGLEACGRSVLWELSRSLTKLQNAFNALICMSHSIGAGVEVRAHLLDYDTEILEALKTLPPSLPNIFQRILDRCRESAAKYQVHVLQLLGAALRPLSLDEFEEAISVVPGNANITDHYVSDMHSVPGSCKSLVVLDEEQPTLHFMHPSAKRFIFGQFQDGHTIRGTGIPFSEHEADSHMGQIVITYLSWEGFNASVSKYVTTPLAIGPMPARIIDSIPKRTRRLQIMAIKLLEGNKHHTNMAVDLTVGRNGSQPVAQYNFLRYAQNYWLHHTKSAHESSREIFGLFKTLTMKDGLKENAVLWKQQPTALSDFGTKDYRWAKTTPTQPYLM